MEMVATGTTAMNSTAVTTTPLISKQTLTAAPARALHSSKTTTRVVVTPLLMQTLTVMAAIGITPTLSTAVITIPPISMPMTTAALA